MTNKTEIITKDEIIHPVAVQQDQYMGLIQMAVEKGTDINQLEKLMDLQDRYEDKNARKSFFVALSKFQSELPVIEKKGNVSYNQTNFDFAKIEDIAKAIKPFLVTNGLSYRFEMSANNNLFKVVCIINHIEGHEERSEMEAFADNSGKKNGIQQIASTQSYLKRYTLTAALGVIVGGEDNDGSSYEEPSNQDVFCSQELFDQSFPAGEAKILAKEKTPKQIIEFFEKKVKLTDKQKETINNVGKA